MTQPLAQKFMHEMEGTRDRVYGLAVLRAGPGGAEGVVVGAARELFAKYAKEGVRDVGRAMEAAIGNAAAATPAAEGEAPVMPADVWARVAAAVQQEGAKSSITTALHPESVLLKPDPLLAPRKKSSAKQAREEFDLGSPSGLLVAGVVVVLIGAAVTAYVMTRPAGAGGKADGAAATTTAATSTTRDEVP